MNWDQKYFRDCAIFTLLAMLLFALAPICQAQDEDDDDEQGGPALPFASLTLDFDTRGNADAHLWLDQKPPDWGPIKAALGQALHCSPQQFSQPRPEANGGRYLERLKPEQRTRYEQAMADYRERQLWGKCDSVLQTNGWRVDGTLSFQALRDVLAKEGKQQLSLMVKYPKAGFVESSFAGMRRTTLTEMQTLSYIYPLSNTTADLNFSLSYGHERAEILRLVEMSAGFLLLPVLIVLWMRRAALKDADDDPVAAWFSYFKTLQWCGNATLLIWMVARTGMREGLQEALAFHFGAHTWQAGLSNAVILIAPPWTSYFICLTLSYAVFVRMRGNQWKRGEFLLNQMFTVGMQALPLMFVLMAIELVFSFPKGAVAAFVAAYGSRILCVRGKMALSRTAPEALTTGELRDRVFGLAQKAKVNIKQIFVLGAGRDQMANAFAVKNNMVMFTDYLLQKLSKKEVDAVAAHELSHLQHRHPAKLGFMILGVIFSPSLFHYSWRVLSAYVASNLYAVEQYRPGVLRYWTRIDSVMLNWRQMDLVIILMMLGAFYLLSRHFERVADEGSVRLTGDAESMITALLRISRLNLTPIQWGKVTGSVLTHPSTLKRVELLARVGNVTPDRLPEIIKQYQQEQKGARGTEGTVTNAQDHYPAPEIGNSVLSTMETLRRTSSTRWLLIFAHALLPSLVVLAVQFLRLSGGWRWEAYGLGAALVLAAYSVLTVFIGARGWKTLRERFVSKFRKEGIAVPQESAILMGFSPGPQPRFFVSGYDWDVGLLFLQRDRITYLGDKVRFALKREQIFHVRLGPSAPGWWNSRRVYVDWQDGGKQAIFSFLMKGPSSPMKVKRQGPLLYAELQKWRQGPGQYPEASAELAKLGPPDFGEVTSRSPKSVVNFNSNLGATILVLLAVVGGSTLLNISPRYGIGVALLLRLYEMVPYWRYREQALPAIPPPGSAKAQAGTG